MQREVEQLPLPAVDAAIGCGRLDFRYRGRKKIQLGNWRKGKMSAGRASAMGFGFASWDAKGRICPMRRERYQSPPRTSFPLSHLLPT